MKLRPVLLVLSILLGFYYVTTLWIPACTIAALINASVHGINTSTLKGPLGSFTLQEAAAAPAYDTEEQQNIAVYKRVLPSVVNITSTELACCDFFLRPVPQQGQGSGFIVDTQGHIVTNNHVVDNAQQVEVTLSNQKKYKATVISVDRIHDLALLQIDTSKTKGAPSLQPVTLGANGAQQVGQQVYAIGNPFGFSGTMTKGIISAIRSIQMPNGSKIEDAIQTDASVNPGNSGGPLLNSKGEVIGITTMIATNPNQNVDQSAGIGFAIPIATVKAVLDDFARFGRARRPSLDIQTMVIGPDLAGQIGLPADSGILIERVLPGGAAEKAGLHGGNEMAYDGKEQIMLGGDFLVGVDGKRIQSPQDLSSALNAHHAGDTITVQIFRGTKEMNVKVILGDAKELR